MEKQTRTDELMKEMKNNKAISVLIIICAVVIGIGSVTSSIDEIVSFFEKRIPSRYDQIEGANIQNQETLSNVDATDVSEVALFEDAIEPDIHEGNESEEFIETFISDTSKTTVNLDESIADQDVIMVPNEPTSTDIETISNKGSTVEISEALIASQEPLSGNDISQDTVTNESLNLIDENFTNINSRYRFANSIPSASTRDASLLAVAKQAADSNYFDLAITIASDIRYGTHKSETFAYIARQAHRQNETEHSFNAASLIPYSSIKTEVMSEIATAPNNERYE